MHGLVNRAIQRFVADSYGEEKWRATMKGAGLDFIEFEAMWDYDQDVTEKVLASTCKVLERGREDVLEDIGTYLVSHPNVSAVRRLLRFGGLNFVEFLHSLDDLPDRARLAVSELYLPRVEVIERDPTCYVLRCYGDCCGWGHVFVGVLRAMADDYGYLAFLEHKGRENGVETVEIVLLETGYAVGRSFDLGAGYA